MKQRTQQLKASVAHSICAWLDLAEKRQHRRVRMWGATTLDRAGLERPIIYQQGANHECK